MHLLQLRRGPRAIRRESHLRPGPGDADDRDAIGRADARLDERLRRAPRDLFVAGRDVGLIENQDDRGGPCGAPRLLDTSADTERIAASA